MARKTNRRDFLLGKAAVQEVGDLIVGALPEDLPRSSASRSPGTHYLLHVGRRAMACEFQVYFNAGQYGHASAVALEVLDLIDALEEQLSFFRPSSQLSDLNRRAAQGPVEVEPGLFSILELALRVHEGTAGALDITSTPLWEIWGFSRRAGRVPSDKEIAEALESVGSRMVELDPQRRTVRFLKPGIRLNLGSIGKGYALDRCAEKLVAAGIEHFLIHGGQSSLLARGAQGSTLVETPQGITGSWIVGLRHPLRPERRLGEIQLHDRALGTSGSQAQSFWHQGRRYGHILDPRTGRPASGLFSATAIAPSAMLADALSTAFYVMPPEAVLEYCRTRPEIGAVLVCAVRRRGGFEVQTAGLDPRDLRLFGHVDARGEAR